MNIFKKECNHVVKIDEMLREPYNECIIINSHCVLCGKPLKVNYTRESFIDFIDTLAKRGFRL